MNAGDLRHRIDLQRENLVQAPDGQMVRDAVEPWITYATVWANVRELSGRELTQARQRQSLIDCEIDLRWRSDLTANHRCLFGERALNFLAARNPDGRRIGLVVDATFQATGA